MSGAETAEAEVRRVNEAFYAAVEVGDLDRIAELSCADRPLVCVHPGVAPIHGTGPVLRSWAMVMASTDYIQFFLTDVQLTLRGDMAVLTCTENMLTAGEERVADGEDPPPPGFRGGKAQAMNVFTRESGGWRMWIHQASPVGSDRI